MPSLYLAYIDIDMFENMAAGANALKVAIKMLLPDQASPKMVVEFLREAAIQGQWSHPNIIGLVG